MFYDDIKHDYSLGTHIRIKILKLKKKFKKKHDYIGSQCYDIQWTHGKNLSNIMDNLSASNTLLTWGKISASLFTVNRLISAWLILYSSSKREITYM